MLIICIYCGFLLSFADEIEEHALNVGSCVQVLRILNTKADIEIEKLEDDLLCLENDLACTEHENWPEICCNALAKRIDQLDAAVTTLKSDHTDYTAMQVLLHSKPAETLHEIVKALREDHRQDSHGKVWLYMKFSAIDNIGVSSCIQILILFTLGFKFN